MPGESTSITVKNTTVSSTTNPNPNPTSNQNQIQNQNQNGQSQGYTVVTNSTQIVGLPPNLALGTVVMPSSVMTPPIRPETLGSGPAVSNSASSISTISQSQSQSQSIGSGLSSGGISGGTSITMVSQPQINLCVSYSNNVCVACQSAAYLIKGYCYLSSTTVGCSTYS